MQLKTWILDKLNRMESLLGRPDLPQRADAAVPPRPSAGSAAAVPQIAEHLGPYAPLIEAIRDELQQFATGQLRLHLAIAERDRFLLSSIDIGCDEGDGDALELLRCFVAEFKPEQIRRYLAREVVGSLPNAASIDLSQFAGLRVLSPGAETAEAVDEYAELLAELRKAPSADARAYSVALAGRWAERESEAPRREASAAATVARADLATPQTPLAGHRLEVEIEDARGSRRVGVAAVVAGRRYSVGKGEGCDIAVDGTYASRRHAELWFDKGAWWLQDAGSTNGVRVEVGSKVVATGGPQSAAEAAQRPIELPPGARIVLSALAEGAASDYPSLRIVGGAGLATPIAAARAPTTPITPIVAPPRAAGTLLLSAQMASGERSAVVDSQALPFGVGRSRSQALVVDLAHASVSGQHLEIVGCDGEGAEVVVHGDNGVVVDGAPYPAGARFRWLVGQKVVLGRATAGEPVCTLVLSKR